MYENFTLSILPRVTSPAPMDGKRRRPLLKVKTRDGDLFSWRVPKLSNNFEEIPSPAQADFEQQNRLLESSINYY
jgi:hypothetical protein